MTILKIALFSLSFALIACSTTQTPTTVAATSESNYTASKQSDGSIELEVTATTSAPTTSTYASLPLGDMLKSAAAEECPAGYAELSQDSAPTVKTQSGKLIATLRGVVRCK